MFENINEIIKVIHGGLAEYDQNADKFVFLHCSEEVIELFGRKKEFCIVTMDDVLEVIWESDQKKIENTLRISQKNGEEFHTYFRLKNTSNYFKWYYLSGWKSGENYFVLFSEMPPETQLLQNIAEEIADAVYVIDKENHNLLYANELSKHNSKEEDLIGKKCYQILHGRTEPCEFCTLNKRDASDESTFEEDGRFFTTKCWNIDWNGVDACVKYVRDITEEVVSCKEKEQLEQYFQTVIKYLPGGMAVVRHNSDGSIRPEYLSDGFAEMLDMNKKEAWKIYEESALSGVHPEDQEYVAEYLEQCIKGKKEKNKLQYRLKKKNGEYIWVKAEFSIAQFENDEIRVYVNYYDITREKQMQEQMYQQQIYQHYTLAGPDVLVLGHCNIRKNKIYEIVDYTDSDLLKTFGNVREEFFTGIGTFIIDEKEREEFYSKYLNKPLQQAYDEGIKEVLMSCFVQFPKQSVGKYVQFKVILVEEPEEGAATGILSVTDITEKKIREKIFMQVSSSNYDLVANIDLFSDTYEIISGGDKNIREEKGSLSERIQKVIQETAIDNEQEREYIADMLNPSQILERLKEKGSYSFIYSVYGEKGEIRTKNMTVAAVDIRLGRVCFIRVDVTDVVAAERKAKKDLEKALTEARKANQVKSDFLSSMSHDIRTPMNAIVGMTTLALENLGNMDKIKDYLHKISVSSQHLLSLINDILDMSQIEQSKIHLNCQSIRIEELVNHISSIMTPLAENKGLHFTIEASGFTHVRFSGDVLRIKQILINLLSNAFKFTREGGNILFRTEEITSKKEGYVRYCFTIQDNGIGIKEELIKHLYDPFIRSSEVAKVEGTGLGLSITKGLVDLMGGEIRVSSELQKGTKFEVELEFELVEETEEDRKKEASEITKEDLSGYHFLLVEDNEINSEILGELLQMWGATFTIKTDGLQAVNEFKQAKPGTYDAIFMDIQMPVMNGYEATKEIRKLDRPDAKSMIILAMTANAFAEDVQAAMEAGMNGHIAKPVDMKLLYSTIIKLLRKKG